MHRANSFLLVARLLASAVSATRLVFHQQSDRFADFVGNAAVEALGLDRSWWSDAIKSWKVKHFKFPHNRNFLWLSSFLNYFYTQRKMSEAYGNRMKTGNKLRACTTADIHFRCNGGRGACRNRRSRIVHLIGAVESLAYECKDSMSIDPLPRATSPT